MSEEIKEFDHWIERRTIDDNLRELRECLESVEQDGMAMPYMNSELNMPIEEKKELKNDFMDQL